MVEFSFFFFFFFFLNFFFHVAFAKLQSASSEVHWTKYNFIDKRAIFLM